MLGDQNQDGEEEALSQPWWTSLGKQSEQGILLKVDKGGGDCLRCRGITELLLYAAVKLEDGALPTPPASSSPAPDGESCPEEMPKEVKVYALPLSSTIISEASNSMLVIPPSPEDTPNFTPACFLPDFRQQTQVTLKTQGKRQSLSSLFDDATQKRRKLKGRGGERVAQAMASLDRPASQHSILTETWHQSDRQSQVPGQGTMARQGLTRAATISSIPGPEIDRPASRSRALANGKHTSLHRVESAISPLDSPTLSGTNDSYENQNKAALTKVTMAGMRLYGLQQKKKIGKGVASQGPSTVVASNGASWAEREGDDEYKLVYHQTIKAATFAFRRQFFLQVIPQETMRDVVDRLLTLFCGDPMVSTGSSSAIALLGFGTHGFEASGAFDLPSGKTVSPRAPTSRTSIVIENG